MFSSNGVAVTPSMSAKCAIEDISPKGARLSFSYAMVLPWHFVLRFDEDGREEQVQMIWRNGAIVGVAFSRPIQMAAFQKAPAAVQAEQP
jgi:hypothetical protein